MPTNYSASVNEEQFTFDNLNTEDLDFVREADGQFHVLLKGKAYRAEILHLDYQNKSFKIRINGNNYQVELADHYDQLIDRLGLKVDAGKKIDEIAAPMPGLVLEIQVNVGDQLQEGEPLLILEAMKMENVIKAPTEVVVKEIKVAKGDSVDKNQVLITFEE
ncbi:MAG TPA: biotin/lipoyl-containing protein [Saprospiraceae bacterium]|nr:biotin/lipoyl-containing protein [Saprospiraceae bacterium]